MRIFLVISIFFFVIIFNNDVDAQCSVNVDTANILHIACPNGGAIGSAQIIQATYLNYSWQNITNGQFYNGGGAAGGTIRTDLDAGFYVVKATSPYSSSCPSVIYSDTFQIRMPIVDLQSNPTQACPNICNVLSSINLTNTVANNTYFWKVDNLSQNILSYSFSNLCGGIHTYEIFANSQSCGIDTFEISQLAPMNLSATVSNAICNQGGEASINITGVGASALSNYCLSGPQLSNYSIIKNVSLLGDNTSISNNTSGICNLYSDFTSYSADVSPGSSYIINLDLGTCDNFSLVNIAKIYIDWNIDGDFDDLNETVATIQPTQSPSNHQINFTVPVNAIPGNSRMRIVMQNNQWQSQNQANSCDYNTAWFGETEDYSIIVSGSVATPITYLWSNGDTSQTITNLSAGTYNVTITDANGCSATETVVVSDSLNLSVTSNGSQTICNGDVPNSLSAISSSIGTYSWHPSAHFIDPNVQNPVFASGITSTTIYTCTFTSGTCSATDTVLITVNPIPTANLSTLPNPACLGDSILLTVSTSIPVNRYRFQYNNGGGWTNMTSPGMSTLNSQIYNHINTSTQFRVKVREDNGCNTSAWSPIITVPITDITTNLTPSSLQMYCQNSPISHITVIANGGVTPYQYQWYEYSPPNQALGATMISNAIDSFIVPSTNIPGITYNYCVVRGGQNCVDTTGIIAVEIVPEPIITLHPQDTIVCTGDNLTINIEDSLVSTVGQTTHIYQWYENSTCDTSISGPGGAVPCTGPGNNTNIYTPQTTNPGTTYYFCTVVIPQVSGCNTVISECAEVIVNPAPMVTLSVSPNPACSGDDIVLTASTSMPVNNYRFQYNSGSGWVNMSNPAFDVINPIVFSNISTSTQFRVQVREYNGCNNSNWSSIITVPMNTIVTQPINHN